MPESEWGKAIPLVWDKYLSDWREKKANDIPIYGVPKSGGVETNIGGSRVIFFASAEVRSISTEPDSDGWSNMVFQYEGANYVLDTKWPRILSEYTVGDKGVWVVFYGKRAFLHPPEAVL